MAVGRCFRAAGVSGLPVRARRVGSAARELSDELLPAVMYKKCLHQKSVSVDHRRRQTTDKLECHAALSSLTPSTTSIATTTITTTCYFQVSSSTSSPSTGRATILSTRPHGHGPRSTRPQACIMAMSRCPSHFPSPPLPPPPPRALFALPGPCWEVVEKLMCRRFMSIQLCVLDVVVCCV